MAPPTSVAAAPVRTAPAPRTGAAGATKAPPPAPAKQTVTDWFGDRYMKVDVTTKDGRSVPTRISLKDGDVTAKRLGDGDFELKYKGKTYLAVPLRGSGGEFAFYEKLPMGTMNGGDVRLGNYEGAFRPVSKREPFAAAFREANAIANGSAAPALSPADQRAQADAKAIAGIPAARTYADGLKASLAAGRPVVEKAAANLNKQMTPLIPLLEKGLVTIGPGEDGLTQVKMQRPPGMTDKEWKKLEDRYGALVDILGMDINKAEGAQRASAGHRELDAARLYEQLNSPSMVKYFESLPQPKRMQEFNAYASMLQGTPAGTKLADDLFGKNGARTDIEPKGALRVSSELGRTVLKGVYDSNESRTALQGLTLALAPNIASQPYDLPYLRRERIVEINLGRPLTDAEKKVVDVAAQGPEKLAELMTEDGAKKHGVPIGLASEVMAKLGGMPHALAHSAHDVKVTHDALQAAVNAEKAGIGPVHHANTDSRLAPIAKSVMVGASFLSAVDATTSVAHFLEHPGIGTGAHAAEGVARSLHIFGETMETFGANNWLTTSAKATGVVAGALALGIDIARDARSPDAKESKVMNIVGDIAIIGGTIAGGPLGLALGIVGGAYKYFGGDGPSESYDQAYEAYHDALKDPD